MIPAYGLGSIVLSDFNGDGKLECCVGGRVWDGILLLGNATELSRALWLSAPEVSEIAAGDFNLDGKPDLAVGGLRFC